MYQPFRAVTTGVGNSTFEKKKSFPSFLIQTSSCLYRCLEVHMAYVNYPEASSAHSSSFQTRWRCCPCTWTAFWRAVCWWADQNFPLMRELTSDSWLCPWGWPTHSCFSIPSFCQLWVGCLHTSIFSTTAPSTPRLCSCAECAGQALRYHHGMTFSLWWRC